MWMPERCSRMRLSIISFQKHRPPIFCCKIRLSFGKTLAPCCRGSTRPDSTFHCNSKVFVGFWVCAAQTTFSTPNWESHLLMDLAWCTGMLSCSKKIDLNLEPLIVCWAINAQLSSIWWQLSCPITRPNDTPFNEYKSSLLSLNYILLPSNAWGEISGSLAAKYSQALQCLSAAWTLTGSIWWVNLGLLSPLKTVAADGCETEPKQ